MSTQLQNTTDKASSRASTTGTRYRHLMRTKRDRQTAIPINVQWDSDDYTSIGGHRAGMLSDMITSWPAILGTELLVPATCVAIALPASRVESRLFCNRVAFQTGHKT